MTDSVEDVRKEIKKLTKATKKLQTNYTILSKSLKEINKNMKFLLKTVQLNKDAIEEIEQLNQKKDQKNLLLHSSQGDQPIITRDTFLPALNTILHSLRITEKKDYVDILTVKEEFNEKYRLSNETDFVNWLLEAFWSREIELLSGINSRGFAVKDMYENVYHYVKL
jgi:hypothetical protein